MLKLHPAIVHFPIALLLLAGLFGVISVFANREFWKDLTVKFLITGVILTPLAVLSGVMEVLHLRHNEAIHKLLTIHQYNGFAILAFYLLLLGWYWFRRKVIGNREYIPFVFCLFLGSMLVLYQGYVGGEMVFREGAGVKPMEMMMEERGHEHGHEKEKSPKHDAKKDSVERKKELKDMKY